MYDNRRSREFGPEPSEPKLPEYDVVDGEHGWSWLVIRRRQGVRFAAVVASCPTREARDAAFRLLSRVTPV